MLIVIREVNKEDIRFEDARACLMYGDHKTLLITTNSGKNITIVTSDSAVVSFYA